MAHRVTALALARSLPSSSSTVVPQHPPISYCRRMCSTGRRGRRDRSCASPSCTGSKASTTANAENADSGTDPRRVRDHNDGSRHPGGITPGSFKASADPPSRSATARDLRWSASCGERHESRMLGASPSAIRAVLRVLSTPGRTLLNQAVCGTPSYSSSRSGSKIAPRPMK